MRAITLMITGLALSAAAMAGDFPQTVRTSDGRAVQLRGDGTWIYKTRANASAPASIPKTSTSQISDAKGLVTIWFDPAKWSKLDNPRQLSPSASLGLIHKSGEAYGIAIVERIPVPMGNLKKLALMNARSAAPDARVVNSDTRRVNGADVEVVDIEGTIEGIPFRYHNLYWSSQKGAVQVVTFTSQNLFQEYRPDFENLLSGVVLAKAR